MDLTSVNAILRWLNNVSCLFLLITSGSEYNFELIEVDWLTCISLTVVGAILVIFRRCWRKIYTILRPMASKAIPEEMSQTM